MTPYKIRLPPEFHAVIETFERTANQINELLASPQFQQKMQQIAETLTSFPERMEALHEEIRLITSELARRGWYPSNEMNLPFAYAVKEAFNTKNGENVDELMSKFVRSRIEALRSLFVEKFQSRSPAISSAINAHFAGQYFLSVPVFLIQAEGICVEEFTVKLYSTDKGYPVLAKALEQLGFDDFTAALLYPLMKPMGISQSEKYRKHYPDCLNRHEILHGIDSSYGTEINSLKALSLLEYVATILLDAKQCRGQ